MKALRILGVACACTLLAAAPPHTQLYGFTATSSDAEYALEERYLDIPSAAGALEAAAALAARPHYAGTPGDYALASYVRDRFKAYGFDATLEPLTARIDVPKKLELELIPTGIRRVAIPAYIAIARRRSIARQLRERNSAAEPTKLLDLRELPDPSDPDTENPAIGLPFVAGSADGDVTAPLVYASRGLPGDYGTLSAHGVSVKGAVLLIRVGAASRGELVRRAQAYGAVGVILYNDPADDGYGRGPTIPHGPWRPAGSVERGSVGQGVTIPVLPISAANARTLLGSLKGPPAPRPWAGALPVGYPIARGPATVHLHVELERRLTTLWNTIGVLPGSYPAQTIVLGAQRDAWVYGIGAGGGGTVTLLEVARGLGTLARGGWTPNRTIVLAAWDGEELGAYGSLAYLKRHGDDVRPTSIAYLSTEPGITGAAFGADAVAAIASTIAAATHVVPDPARPGGTIYDRWAFRSPDALPPVDDGRAATDRPPFLFGAGTPSANATFSGPFGPYDSSYDTLQFARTFSDPQFDLHRSAAQIYGIAALRLADADAVPYQFGAYVGPMKGAVRALASAARSRKLALDARAFDQAIRTFARAAARCDAATKRVATAGRADRELEAARILDIAAYGSEGGKRIAFPDVVAAIRAGDQAALDTASARVRGTLQRASSLIGS